jgi:hypothetical protein
MSFLRFLMLLSLVTWVGGIIFFAFVVAPALFTIVPSQHVAGLVVARSLTWLHWMGIVAACFFLISSWIATRGTAKNVLVMAMLALTLVLQFGIVRRMEQLRASVPNADVSVLARNDPMRAQFDRLHSYSTKLEGSVLLLGLITIFLVAREGTASVSRFSATQH